MGFDPILWYDKPAEAWTAATPIGNGRMGAMIFGGVERERIQINDDTLYSGEPGDRDLDLDITGDFDRVRSLISQGRYAEADDILADRWTGRAQPCYQPLGDVHLHFQSTGTDARGFKRQLDMSKALCRISYEVDGVKWLREAFASYPADVIVYRISCTGGVLDASVSSSTPHPTGRVSVEPNGLVLSGQAPGLALRRTLEYVEERGHQWKYPELWNADGSRKANASQLLYGDDIGGKGMFFELKLALVAPEGTVTAGREELYIRGGTEALLLISTGTSYNGFDTSPSCGGVDPGTGPSRSIAATLGRSFEEIYKEHLDDYRRQFGRVAIDLGNSAADSRSCPTDRRLALHVDREDPELIAQYFQFGRYLMIAGSRRGSQPLNLQGIWNEVVIPPWASGYTTNINAEMNYWPGLSASLEECYEPMLRLIRELSVSGGQVASRMYGRKGWTAHHNTTIWRSAQPVDGMGFICLWPMGAGWLCQHLWDYFLYTGDTEFLNSEAYPLIQGAAEFFADWLIEDTNGNLVTPISNSPENRFRYKDPDGTTKISGICVGSTMDMAIVGEVFGNYLAASKLTGNTSNLSEKIEAMIPRLKPFQIGSKGQLLEWHEEFEENEPEHRHVSHLYGLHPGFQITPESTPDLFQAVKKSLELRGDRATGWSMGWKINLWARLRDGNHAHRMLKALVTPERTYTNFFDAHPPFQIDGNFGGTAGVIEMLCQSRYFPGSDDPAVAEIRLLPALPDAWPTGSISGISTRGGFVLDICWENGELTEVGVHSNLGTPSLICYGERFVRFDLPAGGDRTYSIRDFSVR